MQPSRPPSTRLPIDITSTGRVNGASFTANGTGVGDAGTGDWDFEVTFADKAADADAFATLVGILILPTVVFGREDGSTRNLLSLVGGNLEFTQLTDGDEVSVASRGSIRATPDGRLSWTSEAEGEIGLREVKEVEPFDAVMLPLGPGKIADVLTFPFVTPRGRRLVQAVRTITFNPAADLPGVQFRRVSIEPTATADGVRVRTQSLLRAPARSTVAR
jgi:hypothetical protein